MLPAVLMAARLTVVLDLTTIAVALHPIRRGLH
jgi:hypothetical protein